MIDRRRGFRLPLFWKLYAGLAAVVLLAAGVIGGLLSFRAAAAGQAALEARLRDAATLLQVAIGGDEIAAGDAALQERVRQAGEELGIRLTVIRRDGLVIADSTTDPAVMDDHSARPEVVGALSSASGWGSATRVSNTLKDQLLYVALAVKRQGRPVAVARASLPVEAFAARAGSIWVPIAFAVAIALLVGLPLARRVSRRVTEPLGDLTASAATLARGEPATPVAFDSEDEISDAARSFNEMSATLVRRLWRAEADRDQLRAILEGMIEGVVALDPDQRVIHLNRAASDILGVDERSSAGQRLWEIARFRALDDALESAADGGGRFDARLPAPGGGERVVEINASPLSGAGSVLVLHDVTDLRHLESVRTDFVANVSHELKTPVAAIGGLIETILEDDGMEEATRSRFLHEARKQALRLSALINDLLALSRLEGAPSSAYAGLVDLRDSIEQSLRSQRHQAEAKRLELSAEVPDEPLEVRGSPEDLRQAADNLLSNAIRYTPEGGRVTVRLERHGDQALVEVEDTGIGIDPVHLDRIFERFYRVDQARSRQVGGTGLGLSIVKHVVRSHRGSLGVDSRPGRGSIFRIWLPLSEPGPEEKPAG